MSASQATQTLDEIEHTKQSAEDAAKRSSGALHDYEWDRAVTHDTNSAGMEWAARVRRFPEIFRDFYDPDILAPSPPLPAGVQAAFEDVFPEESKSGKLKVALHPFMQRWAVWERVACPDEGTTENSFVCVSLFMEKPVPGELPADLQTTDRRFWHLRGQIGAHRVPHRGDFEILKRFDRQRTKPEAMVAEHQREVVEERKNEERFHEAYTHDMLGYSFNGMMRAANREAGSGWNPISHPERVHKQDPERYVREVRHGFTIVRKLSALEAEWRRAAEERTRLEEAQRQAAVAELEARGGEHHVLHEAKAILTGEGPDERRARAERAKAAQKTM